MVDHALLSVHVHRAGSAELCEICKLCELSELWRPNQAVLLYYCMHDLCQRTSRLFWSMGQRIRENLINFIYDVWRDFQRIIGRYFIIVIGQMGRLAAELYCRQIFYIGLHADWLRGYAAYIVC